MGEITLEGLKDAFLNHLTVVENDNDDVRYKDFYFDARYPGDDYINVSDEDAKLAEETMLTVYDAVTEWVNKQSESKEDSSLLDKAIAAMNK